MPLYKLRRHVIYRSGCQETEEVWGVDRRPARLVACAAPRDTDRDDPLRSRSECATQLLKHRGDYVTWENMMDWLSDAEEAGYEVVSGFNKFSPFSTIILRGP
jgi:hypothetical protein